LRSAVFLEDRPTYHHTETFDPALRLRLSNLGERLNAFRKERPAAHDLLTMTALYNVLERVRELENASFPSSLLRAIFAGSSATTSSSHRLESW
jgi:hypothetical protein